MSGKLNIKLLSASVSVSKCFVYTIYTYLMLCTAGVFRFEHPFRTSHILGYIAIKWPCNADARNSTGDPRIKSRAPIRSLYYLHT